MKSMKKTSFLVSVAMLLGSCMLQFPASAATTEVYNENFDSRSGQIISNVTTGIDLSGSGLGWYAGNWPKNRSDITGTIKTDTLKGGKSLLIDYNGGEAENPSSNISMGVVTQNACTPASGEGIVIEYSFKAEDKSAQLYVIGKNSSGSWWWGQISCVSNGSIKISSTPIATYEIGKWYHVVLCIQPGTNQFTAYVNNKKTTGTVTTNALDSIAKGARAEVRNTNGIASSMWLDDFKCYTTDDILNYSPGTASIAQITAVNDAAYTVDESKMTITVPSNTTLADLKAGVTLSAGALLTGNDTLVDGETVSLVSENGTVYSYRILVSDGKSYVYNENFDFRSGQIISNVTTGIDLSGSGLGWYAGNWPKNRSDITGTIKTDTLKGGKSLLIDYNGGEAENPSSNISMGVVTQNACTPASGEGIVIEYSFKAEDKSAQLYVIGKNSSGSWWWGQISCVSNGSIKISSTPIATYEIGKWYHVVLCIQPGTNQFTAYVNNKKTTGTVTTNALDSIAKGARAEVRNTNGIASSMWLDDFKCYPAAETFVFDPETEGTICTVTSSIYDISEDNKTISLPAGTTANELESNVTIPDGASINIENTVIADGTRIGIVSKNGSTVNTYTVKMASIKSDVYDIDGSAYTISGVSKYTSPAQLLAAIEPNDGVTIKDSANNVVTTGYVDSTMKVCVGSDQFTIVEKAAAIDADFEGKNAAASDLGNLYLSAGTGVVTQNDEKGSKALKYVMTDPSWTNFFTYRSDFKFTGSYNFEFSFMAEDLNSSFKLIAKENSNFGDFNPDFEIKNGVMEYVDPSIKVPEGGEPIDHITIAKYEPNKWYHVVYSCKMKSDSENARLSIYVNGDCVLNDKEIVGDTSKYLGYERFEARNAGKAAATFWLDDVKLYQTGINVYDAAYEGTEVGVTSDSLNIQDGVIYLDQKSYLAEDLTAKLNFIGDADSVLVYNADGSEFDGDTITPGMRMTIKSVNGNVMKYYTFANEPIKITAKNASGEKLKSTFDGGKITLAVNMDKLEEDNYKLIAASYTAGVLSSISCVPATQSTEFTPTSGADTVKVFVIDFTTMKSACGALVLTKQN